MGRLQHNEEDRHQHGVLEAFHANTLKDLLNVKLEKKGLPSLNFGIGIDYGRALMINAGYSGSGINDVVYMGDVVNSAAHLAHRAGRGGN